VRNGRLVLLVAVAVAGGPAGCQDREVVGGVVVKSVPLTAASGGYITVTADQDPLLAGMWLSIPPGSLPRDLTVTIERGGQDLAGTTTEPAGPVVIVGPVGTSLAIPALLGLPARQGTTSDRLFIEVRDPDGGRSQVEAAATGPDTLIARVDIDRFAAFQAGRLRPGAAPETLVPPPPPAGP
jgi:hypothetical protein